MNRDIFDRKLQILRQTRAAASIEAHDFLLRRASEEIAFRLGAVERQFPIALNLGAHHGGLSRAIVALPTVGTVISCGRSWAMLQKAPPPLVVADEEALPFAPASLHLAVSALSLHLVNDLPGALVQIRRALKPDGLFLAAVLGGDTLRELRKALVLAEIEISGGASPRVAPMADVRDYGALLQRAGFALPVADADRVRVTYADMLALIRDIRGMGAANSLLERRRGGMRRGLLLRAAELYAEMFPAPGGRIEATFEIITLTGWAPHESQQKPLRPGSAAARLADVLGVEERAAGDKGAFPLTKNSSKRDE